MKSCDTAPDRQQRDRILRETERNVLVQASAGTGKTTLMVDRVVQLVKEGVPLEEIAVVTFTNPAAAELRLRIRKKLREEKKKGCGECQRALSVISTAWISTIHGFASRLLREFFNLTGVDPDFTTTETHFSPLEMKRMWDTWLLTSKIPAEAGELLSSTGTERQRNIGIGIEEIRWLDSIERVGSEEAVLKIFQDFVGKHGRELERTLETCTDRTDKLFVLGAKFIKGMKLIGDQLPLPDPELVEELTGLLRIDRGSGKNWPDKDEVKKIYVQVRDEYSSMAQVLVSCPLTAGTWRVAGSFARVMREQWDGDPSRLSYDDLLFKACSAVEGSRLLSELLSSKFRHVLIDEFQDTSIDQTQLFRGFLEKDGKLPPGVITVVADDKQSIYGWRNADIETYGEFRRRMEESGALSLTITTNFRSTESIVRFVNVFGRKLFENQTPEEVSFGCVYSPIEPSPEASAGRPVSVMVLPDMPEELKKTYSEPSWQSLQQARWFGNFVKEGLERGDRPEDYALLYRSSTHVHHFSEVLERMKIPYRISSRDFLKRQEILDLREILRTLTDPGDTQAWVHTLRSLFFGLPDTVVSRSLKAGYRCCDSSPDEPVEEVEKVNSILRELRDAARRLPLADFLPELYFRTELIPVLAATGHQTSRRLGNLQHILGKVLNRETDSMEELIHLLDEELAPKTTEEPSTVPAEGGAVTLCTIHAAKGLAWKHVAVAALPTRTNSRRDCVIEYEHGRKAAFDFGVPLVPGSKNRIRSPYWPEILRTSKARELAETRRLIYVAVTRARDSLTLFAAPVDLNRSRKTLPPACILWESLQAALGQDPECCHREEMEPFEPRVMKPVRITSDGASPAETADGEKFFPVDPKPRDWQEHGAYIGDCVHTVLEKIDLTAPEQWLRKNREYLRRLFEKDLEEVKGLVMNLFEMELPFSISDSKILGREYTYFVKTPSGVKTRYIDLLLRDENGSLIVADYKTDSFDGSSSEEVVNSYLEKQRYYLKDIAGIFGEEPRGYLIFLREKTVVSIHCFERYL